MQDHALLVPNLTVASLFSCYTDRLSLRQNSGLDRLVAFVTFVAAFPAGCGRSLSIISKVVWIVLFAASNLFLCHALLTCRVLLVGTCFTG